MTTPAAPLTASADSKPCEVHGYHWPPVLVTEGHHIYPVYLQNEKYGRIQIPELRWVCSTGHDNIHAWIYYLLGERKTRPRRLGTRKEMELAKKVVAWFRDTPDNQDTA